MGGLLGGGGGGGGAKGMLDPPHLSNYWERGLAPPAPPLPTPMEGELQPILREEVEIAVAVLNKGKPACVDNIPAELVQADSESMIDVLTKICYKIWKIGEWPTPWA